MILQRGVKLEQQKSASLRHKIKDIPVPEGIEEPRPLPPRKGKLDAGGIIAAAEAAGIVDEFDGAALDKKLRRLRRLKPDMLVACCFDEDPCTTSAMAALRENTHAMIAGLVLAARACGAAENKIAVATSREARVIRKINPQADLIVAGERYPARVLLKRKLYASGKNAAYVGAQALLALTAAVDEDEPQGFTVVTVAGDGVDRWRNLRVRIGTPLKFLLDACEASEKTKVVITGSSVTGKAVTDLSEPVTAATRCVIALRKPPRNKTYPCIGCEKCERACPRGIVPWKVLREIQSASPDPVRMLNVQKCIGCSACAVACPSGIDLRAAISKAAAYKKSGDFD
ncbi:4Fe-4S dicluster domain-containing protein [Caproiciproducens sp. R2]|uniref:4Fe-4S dicluster domain-containing protein n=1 Tax=Caproiciproducens sp. R2 TaxID=3435187 RepID=UPI004034377E